MVTDQKFFIAYHILNLVIFTVALVFAGKTVSKLRTTSAIYNARLLPFAYFSLSSWILWALQYVIVIASPNGFSQHGLWLGVMQNALWLSAVLSLHSNQFPRMSWLLPDLMMFPVVIASLAACTAVLTSPTFTYIDAVSAATIFTTFAYSILQWRLSKIIAAAFFIHGYSQWIWRSLWLTPLTGRQIATVLAFPIWRIVLLVAWIKLISAMLQRAQPSYQKVVREIERLELPEPKLVMISSTVKDLAQERDAADRAIRGLGLTRFRAETFGSLPHTPRETCASLAKRCDIFILITGEHYGHIIEEGISVVEFEYSIAHDQDPGKILVYVKDGVNRDPQLEEFLKRVQDFEQGYFTSSFTTPEELYETIQRDVTRWLTSHGSKNN